MTRYDLRFLAYSAAAVVAAGLAIGYLVGMLTKTPTTLPGPVQIGDEIAYDTAPSADAVGRDGSGVPGYQNIYVNDYADLLDGGAELRIRSALVELYDRTGIEMTVLTIGSMADYGHDGAIEPFATRLFNAWGIGDAMRDDGVLILVSRYDRNMRIELGSGYSRDRDADMQWVIDRAFLPAFRRDAYQEGLLRGVDETIRQIAGVYPGEYETGTVRRGWSWIFRRAEGLGNWLWALLAVPAGAALVATRRYLRRRPRSCPDCGTLMARAGETADDAHLDGGQRLEEYLRSVDYDVWECPACDHRTILSFTGWFSGMSACKSCGYRTLETTSEELTPATKTSTGVMRVNYDCKHCDFRDMELRTIPKITESSSSSSGGSSFGGGSSSGGGASGSW